MFDQLEVWLLHLRARRCVATCLLCVSVKVTPLDRLIFDPISVASKLYIRAG